MFFSERYNIKRKYLELYEVLDRKPVIFEKEKHILNISKLLILSLYFLPNEIIRNISEYMFYNSKEINLKILDFLVKKEVEKNILEKIILTNNNNDYLFSIFSEIKYNTIFFESPTDYDMWVGLEYKEYSLNIFNYDIKNRNLLILTNRDSRQNYFEDILSDKIQINNVNIIEEIETCFDYKEITKPSELKFYYEEYYDPLDYERQNNSYINNENNFQLINFNEYIYELIIEHSESHDINNIEVLIFKNKVISFSCGWANGNIIIFEINEEGYIITPKYDINDILNMKKWDIEDIIKYDFTIKS
jgi:hypothetical protein